MSHPAYSIETVSADALIAGGQSSSPLLITIGKLNEKIASAILANARLRVGSF